MYCPGAAPAPRWPPKSDGHAVPGARDSDPAACQCRLDLRLPGSLPVTRRPLAASEPELGVTGTAGRRSVAPQAWQAGNLKVTPGCTQAEPEPASVMPASRASHPGSGLSNTARDHGTHMIR